MELEINNANDLKDELEKISIDASTNKPSEEEIEQAKQEFEAAVKEWQTSKYTIGEKADAQTFTDYIKHFLMNRFRWEKEAWMGIIKLTEELTAAETLFKGSKDKGLEVGYQALEFIFFILSSPSGMGLQSAIDFEKEYDLYANVFNAVGSKVEEARNTLKNIEFLQQRWGAMAQGFYLEMEDSIDQGEDLGDGQDLDEGENQE